MVALACFYRTPRRRISLFPLVGATFGCPKTYGFRYTVWLRRWYLQVGSTLYIPSDRHCRVHLYGVPEIRYGFRRTLRRFKYKKAPAVAGTLYYVGIYLSSRHVAMQVLSARQSLTSVFGMGTGGPSASITPTIRFLKVLPECFIIIL